jgi:hypothetical protein
LYEKGSIICRPIQKKKDLAKNLEREIERDCQNKLSNVTEKEWLSNIFHIIWKRSGTIDKLNKGSFHFPGADQRQDNYKNKGNPRRIETASF